MVTSVNQSRVGGLAAFIGIFTLIFGATSVFSHLQEALNSIWEVEIKPEAGLLRTLRRRLWAIVMLPLFGVVVLLTLVIDTMLSTVVGYFGNQIPHVAYVYVLQGLNFVVGVTVLTLVFAMVYKVLPDVEIEWDDVFAGAAFTAFLFSVGQLLLGIYLGRSSVASTYGAAGTFIAVLLWVYYSAQILLFGAEFTQVFARRRGKQIRPAQYAFRFRRRPGEDRPTESTPQSAR
jgi:membrane protein